MAPLSLPQLLEGRDVSDNILARLTLKSLAALSACCQGTRAAVDSQPKALWKALAEAEQSGHPALGAPCMRSYLRRQHWLHAYLASGLHRSTFCDYSCQGWASRELPSPAQALVSPDFARAAFVSDAGRQLTVQDRSLGAVRCKWSLSDLPAGIGSWAWNPQSAVLAGGYSSSRTQECGLVLADATSGTLRLHALPPCTGLLQLVVVGWSSCGALLVMHPPAWSAFRNAFTFVSSCGKVLSSLEAPCGTAGALPVSGQACMCPLGSFVALSKVSKHLDLHLWAVHANTVSRLESIHRLRLERTLVRLAWSPRSDSFILYGDACKCYLSTLIGEVTEIGCNWPHLRWGPASPCSIVHLAKPKHPGTNSDWTELAFCGVSACGKWLATRHTVTGDDMSFTALLLPAAVSREHLALSHDGAHAAVVVYQGTSPVRQLAICSMTSGRLVQLVPLPFSNITGLAWSVADNAVLVAAGFGRQDMLVQFE